MEISIKNDAELESLIKTLATEITDAHVNYRLYKKLIGSIDSYNFEFSQSNTFWYLTLEALKDSALLHLCRVYDQEESSLNLANLLKTLKANVARFSAANFRARLSRNEFVESLAAINRVPVIDEIDADLKLATRENKTVKKLILWRNCIIAHRSAKVSLGKNQILNENQLSWPEIEELLENALRTLNRYSSLFVASVHSPSMVGEDDYMSVLEYIRLGLAVKNEMR